MAELDRHVVVLVQECDDRDTRHPGEVNLVKEDGVVEVGVVLFFDHLEPSDGVERPVTRRAKAPVKY